MEKTIGTKKSNKIDVNKKMILLSLFYSLLVCLAGGIFSGILYNLGYFSYWLSVLVVYCALSLYKKFHKLNWLTFLWVIFWSFAFIELSYIVVYCIEASYVYELSFGASISKVFELLSTDEVLSEAFSQATLINLLFLLLAIVFSLVFFKAQDIRLKKQKSNAMSGDNLTNNSQNKNEADVIKKADYSEPNVAITSSIASKSVETIKEENSVSYKEEFLTIIKLLREALRSGDKNKVKEIYENYIKNSSEEKLYYYKTSVNKLLQNTNLKEEQQKVLNFFNKNFLKF